jgi:enamine deaminase RidA (YjgF/YER057c/UK114 family)
MSAPPRARHAVEEKLASLGLELPSQPTPVGNYLPACRSGALVFTSGQTARIDGVRRYVGVVGRDVTPEEAYLSARDAALNCLACIKQAVGSLDRVRRVVKVLGFVNCVDGYERQPAAINGASDLLVELFGDAGRHARSAVGVRSLPSNVSVELEMIVEVDID